MSQKNALVTGGLQGIGRAIVEKLLKRGDRVFVFDCVPENDPRVPELKELGVGYLQVDISNVDSIKNGFKLLFDLLGQVKKENFPFALSDSELSEGESNGCERCLDILINNAGITRDNLAIRMNQNDWDSVLNVNLRGAFFCAQEAIKRMMRQEKSYIVNISSIVGVSGNAGQTNYAASKAGLIAMTKSLASEYGSRNILINAIAPGFIQTSMTEKLPQKVKEAILQRISLKRFGCPQDVANVVDFLTSGNADYITGAVVDLNGGML
jgi:3-oxoacyl-[acyl-carrier protein] reductase